MCFVDVEICDIWRNACSNLSSLGGMAVHIASLAATGVNVGTLNDSNSIRTPLHMVIEETCANVFKVDGADVRACHALERTPSLSVGDWRRFAFHQSMSITIAIVVNQVKSNRFNFQCLILESV